MNKKPSISVCFPCYNDAKTIGKLITESFKLLSQLSSDFEVIVVDDGSSDNSPKILKNLTKRYKKLKVIFHQKNQGYGGALRSAFSAANKEFIFYTDGDGQYDVKEMPLLLAVMTKDIDIVNGIKIQRQDSFARILLGYIYNSIVRNLFNLKVFDVDCDFRLIRKKALQTINLTSNSGSICVEIVRKIQKKGYRFREISVHHYPRIFGQSQFFKIDKLIKTVVELSKLWFELMILRRT